MSSSRPPPPPPPPPPSPSRSPRSPHSHSHSPPPAWSTCVQETCMEALNGKDSCVSKGYYSDKFIKLFRPSYPPPPAMSPLISRGYFTRVRALELIVEAFERQTLAAEEEDGGGTGTGKKKKVNLVLLGAGLDTFFFRLREQEQQQSSEVALTRCYYEVDFAPVVEYKASCLRANKEISSLLHLPEEAQTQTHTHTHTSPRIGSSFTSTTKARPVLVSNKTPDGGSYALLAGNLAETSALEKALDAAGMDWSLPTLLIAECVLVYMEAEASRALVEWTSHKFPLATWVTYDMILPHDAFGKMMRSNLKSRGLTLPGFESWGRSLETQLDRFVGPWKRAVAGDMNAVYGQLLTVADREKAVRLEHLDEVEEWQMLMGHYCYVVATQGEAFQTLLQGLPGFQERQLRE